MFLRFLGLIQSKREGEQTPIVNTVKPIPELLRKGFQSCFDTLNENLPPMKEIVIFPASLTPQYSYIQQLLDDPYNDLPANLKINFYDTKIGYTTKPDLYAIYLFCYTTFIYSGLIQVREHNIAQGNQGISSKILEKY